MAVDSASVSKHKGSVKDRITRPRKKEGKSMKPSEPVENGVPSPAKRTKSPGIRVVGGRIYDSVNGKTCHQCRQKTRDFVAACTNQRNNKLCPIMFCHKCLLNRYGEKAEAVASCTEWSCPKCRGICNCSICMKKRGHEPTGILINAAKATGFSSVSDMLLNGGEQLANIIASPKKETIPCPRKRGKENSFNGKVDANVPNSIDIKSKKSKLVKNANEDTSVNIIGKPSKKRKTNPEDLHFENKVIDMLHGETGSLDIAKKVQKAKRVRLAEMGSETDGKHGKEKNFGGEVVANLPNSIDIKPKKNKQEESGNVNENSSVNIIGKLPKKRKAKPEDLHRENKVIDILPRETGSLDIAKKARKVKGGRLTEVVCKTDGKVILKQSEVHKLEPVKKVLVEMNDDTKKDCNLAKRTSPRKLTDTKKTLKKGKKLDTGADAKVCEIIVVKEDNATNNKSKKQHEADVANDSNLLKTDQHLNFHADAPLPMGSELTIVAGINVCAKDVGNALQFLEFCAVFRKILDVKKKQSEHVLHDLLHGRTGRRGKFSATVQFHIHLLSFIQEDQGKEGEAFIPSYGKNSWFHALKKCLSESKYIHKAQWLDSLDKAADYETIGTSEKLRILNHLCDVVLGTVKVRNWMIDQNMKLAENVKEARQEIRVARDKEKSFKKKMQDEIARTILAQHGSLSISQHDAIVSCIKAEVAEANARVLESKSMLNNITTCDAVRIEPIFTGSGGYGYWKLNCFGKSDVLLQNIGNGEHESDEKWFVIDEGGKEAIEKYKSSLREKILKSSRGSRIPLTGTAV